MKINNAVIMAAGVSSRFYPNSTAHKALLSVKGEVLIERQIKQLRESGISEIIVVGGHLIEQFNYLKEKFGVILLENKDYLTVNNCSSILTAEPYLHNSYICSCDNYFTVNPFEAFVDEGYYAVVFSHGITKEYCVDVDEQGYINTVTIGGQNRWYMMGHAFLTHDFSQKFLALIKANYNTPIVREQVWESLFAQNLDILKLKIRKYNLHDIFEIDTLEDLYILERTELK